MKRTAAFLLATAIACGGGGGGSSNAGGNNPPNPQLVATAIQVLEACGADVLQTFVDILTAAEALLDPAETNLPDFTVDAVDTALGTIDLSLDNDGVPGPDYLISIQMQDAQGMPIASPFDLTQLQTNGLDDLDQLLQQMPDGSKLVITANVAPPAPQESITFTVNFSGGAPTSASAESLRGDPDCDAQLSVAVTAFSNYAGAVPTITVTLLVNTLDGLVGGDADLDGTTIAGVTVDDVDGNSTSFSLEIDLTTGAVTEVP